MMNSVLEGFIFLISTVFNLYLFVLITRAILAWKKSNYATNLITQLAVKLTRSVVIPVKKFIPDFRNIEFATLALILFFDMLKWFLILIPHGMPTVSGLLILVIADSLKLTLQLFFYAILLQAILSWVQPHSPMAWSLYELTSPITKPFQRLIPPIGGFDISPIPALIILQLGLIVLIEPFIRIGWMVALS